MSFHTTHWTAVLVAGHDSVPGSKEALEDCAVPTGIHSTPTSLREEIAQTVSTPEEVEEELRHLIEIVTQHPL